MNKETVDSMINAIKPVAEKIGEGAAHLYQVYVRQIYVEGIVWLAVGVPISIIGISTGVWLVKSGRKGLKEEPNSDVHGVKIFLAVFLLIASIGLLAGSVSTGILALLNPEYYAIDRILSTVRGK